MRWKQQPKPKEGDIRIIRKFLFFPKKIQNEIRWLEYSYIVQRCTRYGGEWGSSLTWFDVSWDYKSYIIKDVLD